MGAGNRVLENYYAKQKKKEELPTRATIPPTHPKDMYAGRILHAIASKIWGAKHSEPYKAELQRKYNVSSSKELSQPRLREWKAHLQALADKKEQAELPRDAMTRKQKMMMLALIKKLGWEGDFTNQHFINLVKKQAGNSINVDLMLRGEFIPNKVLAGKIINGLLAYQDHFAKQQQAS